MPQALTLDLPDEAATAELAARVGRLLRPGDVVALSGDLGAGKSAFARHLIRSLGDAEEEVPSPTFTLVQTYDLPGFTLWHFDLYRLTEPDEVLELGWEEVIHDGVALVEWPARLGPLLPADRLELDLAITGPDSRCATLTGHGAWASRLGRGFEP
ncbi:tRNA (adenosine(37)-N6)-threonylcarbamoyltransferase complex ATPase subunit type 1 TsaE [Nitrospirillum sp. BR 11752]|uniref:tRNA (adenosine(37)-N6)-threonylcarbamoyltransferase complex ATPase subunit type 1 TsaE n=1 Tax=Nitrospirillum sp. BR 11752 TaxID=3104293 RepID=UPI002ECB6058|nr:tRNA (adenosine(37)-N6)-threonylcarbamoyltransferase complex ATPase subunit type 1 TsaE [Nitrospirillum sp. BR 11752]